MKKLIKQSVLIGLGAATMTKNVLEQHINRVAKTKLTQKDVKSLANDIVKEAKKHKAKVESMLDAETRKAIKQVQIAAKAEAKRAAGRLKKLAGKMDAAGRQTLKVILKDLETSAKKGKK